MKEKLTINETLNELLLKVLSGVDYVSKIALETHKSIPVVHRQLEMLLKLKVLTKQREGKKVTYGVNWIMISDVVTTTLFLDTPRLTRYIKKIRPDKVIMKEIETTMKILPKELFNNQKELNKAVKDFFSNPKTKIAFNRFIYALETSGKEFTEYSKISFNKSIDLFLDAIGNMSKEKQKTILGINNPKSKEAMFIKYCRVRFLQKKLTDPRNNFL